METEKEIQGSKIFFCDLKHLYSSEVGYFQCFRNFEVNCKNSRANGVQKNAERLYTDFNIKLKKNNKNLILCKLA